MEGEGEKNGCKAAIAGASPYFQVDKPDALFGLALKIIQLIKQTRKVNRTKRGAREHKIRRDAPNRTQDMSTYTHVPRA